MRCAVSSFSCDRGAGGLTARRQITRANAMANGENTKIEMIATIPTTFSSTMAIEIASYLHDGAADGFARSTVHVSVRPPPLNVIVIIEVRLNVIVTCAVDVGMPPPDDVISIAIVPCGYSFGDPVLKNCRFVVCDVAMLNV